MFLDYTTCTDNQKTNSRMDDDVNPEINRNPQSVLTCTITTVEIISKWLAIKVIIM